MYKKQCSIARKPGSGQPSKLSNYVLRVVEQQMRLDDETTAMQLHEILLHHGISMSIRTVLRSRQTLGWTYRGSANCQLIREANKLKRLEWAQNHMNDDFKNVV